jgi:hypothetical protein
MWLMFPTRLLEDIPKGEWAALSADETRVVAHGRNLNEVIQAAERAGEPHPVIAGVPEATYLMIADWQSA